MTIAAVSDRWIPDVALFGAQRAPLLLARVQLDDELFVHNRLHFFPGRDARDFAAKSVAIDRKPVGHGNDLRKIEIPQHQLTRFRLVFDRNFVAGFQIT